MSKFNRALTVQVSSPIKTATVSTGKTALGAPGFERDARSELFLLAVTNMVGEKTFHEDANSRDARFQALVRDLAVSDYDWFRQFLGWLRGPNANMRSASLVAAVEAVKARLDAKAVGGNRALISSVLQRADEPGEMLAYWFSVYGRAVPKPVKRGISDAVQRLYNEYGTLKYDTASASVRFGDVLAVCHPDPVAPWQGDLFEWINAKRWNRLADFEMPESLSMMRARLEADLLSRDELLANPEVMKAAGYTWENVAGKGKMDAAAWEAIIPNMGIFALLRNLRNFDEASISREAADAVRAKLTDPAVIAKSRLFPFRFLSAYQAVRSENWGRELESALELSLANVPSLSGRTLIMVDRSGSMWSPAGGNLSDMSRADVAALFGTALAKRSEYADLIQYDNTGAPVDYRSGDSVLKTIRKFSGGGGTHTQGVLQQFFRPGFHDRIIILTDEQAYGGYYGSSAVGTGVPDSIPLHTVNLAGYQYGHAPGGKNRFTMGGLTDAGFRLITLLEAGQNGDWKTVFGDS